MFTLPPKPPKDFGLKTVTNTQASAAEHTPHGLPRATQDTLKKYCYPIPAADDEPSDKSSIVELNDRILTHMAKTMKAWWVDKPGSNAYFLNDLHQKYHVAQPDYDPRYQHRPKVFQRSYKYELDCLEGARLDKLKAKMRREEEEENEKQQKYMMKEKAKEKPLIDIVPCKFEPPFWWQTEIPRGSALKHGGIEIKPPKTTYQSSYPRWQKQPEIFESSLTDPCKRREALALFGQPFKHEASTWYFKNYPPPKIKFIPEKFSQ